MKRFSLLLAAGLLVLMLMPAAFGQATSVWKWVCDDAGNCAWVLTEEARALRTGEFVDSSCNKLNWRVDVTINASVAQWIHWNLNAQGWDWQIMKPGCYAANCIHFWVASNGDVQIDYDGFNDLEAVVPNMHENFIEAWYSWGDTPEIAEAHGWTRAIELNDMFEFLDESVLNDPNNPDIGDLHDGIEYKLFSKVCVVECNTACEYQNLASVTLTLMQQKPWVDDEGGWAIQ